MAAVMSATATVAPAPNIATTHPYTCNTCQVAFRSSDGQRTHMHTDWHRYNLKRRITELPPISSETFAEKVLSSQATSRLERERASFEKICQPCQKTYYSENAYLNHISSGKHKAKVAGKATEKDRDGAESVMTDSVMSSAFTEGTETETVHDHDTPAPTPAVTTTEDDLSKKVEGLKVEETPSVVSNEPDELPITTCLFCPISSETLQLNLAHMTTLHGLFIPESRYLVNLEGLIRYLGEKVLIGNTCLYCNKQKGGLDGVRTHMRDKGHCMIAFENEEEMLEVGEFYDFRSTYDDDEWESEDEDELDADGNDVPRAPKEKEEGGGGWETDSDNSSVGSPDIGSIPVDQVRPLHRTPSHHLSDGWHSHAHVHAIYHTDYELHLPSGRSVGHRSLARYYRQNLGNGPYARQQMENLTRNQRLIENGTTGVTNGTGDMRIARRDGLAGATVGLRNEAAKLARAERKVAERGRGKYGAWVDRKGNSQKHYRDPLLQ